MVRSVYIQGSRPGPKQPSFFWQGVLILLPVVALAVLGLVLLRQDRARVELEIREQAASYAERLADLLERELLRKDSPGAVSFVVTTNGDLIDPKPLERVPIPRPLDFQSLSGEQRVLWERATAAEQAENNAPAILEAWQRVADLDLPREFKAQALFNTGLFLKQQGQQAGAADIFRNVTLNFADVHMAAGLPLKPLAELQWIAAANFGPNEKRAALERCLAAAISDPSMIVPELLARGRELEDQLSDESTNTAQRLLYDVFAPTWQRQQLVRELYASAIKALAQQPTRPKSLPSAFWFTHSPDCREWLAISSSETTNQTFVLCKPLEALSQLPVQELKNANGFGATVDVAGKTFPDTSPKAGAVASATRLRDGNPWITATVAVANPAAFQARARTRVVWFASVIGAALAAASVGLFAAWRAFRRQQALADMKTNFVSSVSHELRAPIASVRLLAEGLQRGTVTEDPGKQQEYFGFIVQECRRLSALIENVLDFSRIEHGRKQYGFELTDATRLVSETVATMVPYAAERKMSLVTDLEKQVVVKADGRALQQALVNLIDNAIKHSPAEGKVTIGLCSHGANNGHAGAVELWVEDRGEGIPAEDHEHIFERFYRRGSELRRETQGVGIGLSIVKHIVDAHSGTIDLRSEVGKGSRFTIIIPSSEREGINE